MANKKISDLAAASTLDGTEVVPLVQGSTTERTTVAAIVGLRNTTSTTVTAATGTIPVSQGRTNVNRAGTVALTLPTAAQMVGYEGLDFLVKDVSGGASETNVISFVAGSGTTLEFSHTIEAPYGALVWYLDGTVWRVK